MFPLGNELVRHTTKPSPCVPDCTAHGIAGCAAGIVAGIVAGTVAGIIAGGIMLLREGSLSFVPCIDDPPQATNDIHITNVNNKHKYFFIILDLSV